MKITQRISQRAGSLIGWISSPLTFAIARARRARMFHPEGITFMGEVTASDDNGLSEPQKQFAQSLAGQALVRFSTALWRGGREWIDALGCALRLDWHPSDGTTVFERHQDLLFATIRLPITTPFAPLTTHQHDFLSNNYFAVSPFETPLGKIKFRLVPLTRAGSQNLDRGEKLRALVDRGDARMGLEIRDASLRSKWVRLAELKLVREVKIDQEALRFSPFQAGLGIRPAGFVHYLRPGTYKGSQAARPKRAGGL